MQIAGIKPVTVEATEQEKGYALEIARVIYGAVEPTSPQWEKCVAAARAASETGFMVRLEGQDLAERWMRAQKAFQDCNVFNKTYSIGTNGILTVGTTKLMTVLEGMAMVYPHAINGEIVMAWFRGIGWRPISEFEKFEKKATLAEELSKMGQQVKQGGNYRAACSIFSAAIAEDSTYWQAHNEIGTVLAALGQHDEAIEHYAQAIKAAPFSGEVRNNRALSLRAVGRAEEALVDALEAKNALPNNLVIWLNLASTLDDLGRVDEVVEVLDGYIARNPEDHNSRYNKALVLLSAGRLKEAWDLYDMRLLQPSVNTHYEHYDIPRWRGEPLDGKRVLVWLEQGLGDEIMFAGVLEDLCRSCSDVHIMCTERLVPVLRRSFKQLAVMVGPRPQVGLVDAFRRQLLPREAMPSQIVGQNFDFQISQGDLGKFLRPDMNSFPVHAGYLKSDEWLTKNMRQQIAAEAGTKLVGITWHSEGNPHIGKMKGFPIEQLEPVLRTPGVKFICLQYGDVAADVAKIKELFGVDIYVLDGFNQMVEVDRFFSLVDACDAVFTVSNSTAHVAGSLNKPTFMLCPTGPGKLWYWFRDICYSPWYPSVRLFRQERAHHWQGAIAAGTEALRDWLKCSP